jgi:hypothetical protein
VIDEKVVRQVTGRLAGRVAPCVGPSPSQPSSDSKRESREIVSWDNCLVCTDCTLGTVLIISTRL